MHWGHAVSRDLVHWREQGDVMAPDEFGPMFSGSAVVDWQNTSKLGTKDRPPLVLLYTAAGQPTVQCLAFTMDGRKVTKFAHNPILAQITDGNRDPKVIWHEPTKRWVMVLYVALPGNKHTVHFFTSPNLRLWNLASIFTGGTGDDHFLFECPDFFELPVDGDATRKKWVLIGANDEHAIGTFDGTTFTAEATKLPGQRGRTFYAAQTFSDEPQGRRIQIGWLRADSRDMPFNQCMSLPRELRLVSTPDGPRLASSPVKELESLRAKSHRLGSMNLQPDSANPLANVKSELVELRAEFEPGAAETIFTIRGATITYDAQKQELDVNGLRVSAPLRGNRQRLTVFCDRTTLEIFASDGLVGVPVAFRPKADDFGLGVQVKRGAVKVHALDVHELKSAWDGQ
jgi:sucrose-6-phosphate hydrolase SacC (GH32 family)